MARALLRDFKTCITGSSGRVDFGDVLNMGSSDFSVSFWFKTDLKLASGSAAVMIGKRAGVGTTAQVGWNICGGTTTNKKINVQISDGTTAVSKIGTALIIENKWHFVTATFARSGLLSMYLDGVLDVTQSIAGIAGTITNAVAMRALQDGSGNNQMRGFMDEIRMYNRVLTAAEITELFNSNLVPASTVVGEWLFDDGGGSTAVDTSGGAHDGTITTALFVLDSPMRARVKNRNIAYSLQCLGGTDNVDIPTLNDISAYTELSFSFWVRHQPKIDAILFGNVGNNPSVGFSIRAFTDDKVRLYHASVNAAYPIPIASAWYHVSGRIVKGSYIQLFVNGVGVAKSTGIASNSLQSSTNTIKIAGNRGTNVLKGNIARVNFWNRALTDNELYSVWKDGTRIASGLIGEWMMDEGSGSTLADGSGNGNIGNITAATFNADSPMKTRNLTVNNERFTVKDFSKSLYFDGSSVVISAATPTGIETAGSMSCWFKLANPATGTRQTLMQAGEGATKRLIMQIYNDGRLAGGFWNGSAYTQKNSGTGVILPGIWYMGTFVWDGSAVQLYLNASAQSAANGLVQSDATTVLRVGSRGGFTQSFQGMIDDAKVWARALTAPEIADMYYKGIVPRGGLFSHWKFDEGSGSTANDASGGANTGTITGATYSTDAPMLARTAA